MSKSQPPQQQQQQQPQPQPQPQQQQQQPQPQPQPQPQRQQQKNREKNRNKNHFLDLHRTCLLKKKHPKCQALSIPTFVTLSRDSVSAKRGKLEKSLKIHMFLDVLLHFLTPFETSKKIHCYFCLPRQVWAEILFSTLGFQPPTLANGAKKLRLPISTLRVTFPLRFQTCEGLHATFVHGTMLIQTWTEKTHRFSEWVKHR